MLIKEAKGRRSFRGKTPRFGTKKNPLPISHQQKSVYYWWWAYLRHNKRYLTCCENGGTGRLAALYRDFGDVRGDSFKDWWATGNRGAYLFAEPPAPILLEELTAKEQWDETWPQEVAMVVVVPMTWSKRSIKAAFGRLLKRRHARGRGRVSLADGSHGSTARYPLVRHYSTHSLMMDLAVYEAVEAAKDEALITGRRRKTLYEIGVAMRFVPSAMPSKDELKNNFKDRNKANVMTVAVSRSYKRAIKMVENVAKGEFPKHL